MLAMSYLGPTRVKAVEKPDPKIERDYDDALTRLLQVAKGEYRLPLSGAEPAAIGNSGVVTNDRERPFTEDNLTGFI